MSCPICQEVIKNNHRLKASIAQHRKYVIDVTYVLFGLKSKLQSLIQNIMTLLEDSEISQNLKDSIAKRIKDKKSPITVMEAIGFNLKLEILNHLKAEAKDENIQQLISSVINVPRLGLLYLKELLLLLEKSSVPFDDEMKRKINLYSFSLTI